MSSPSAPDLVRAALRRVPPRRAFFLVAATAALAIAAGLLLAPGGGHRAPIAWAAAAVALGEVARRFGRPEVREPAGPTAEGPGASRPARAVLILLVLAGVSFRLAWVRWDDGQLLHPDEYGLTGTLTKLAFPKDAAEWFDTARSPMSPYARYDREGRALPGAAPDAAMRWGQWPQLIVRGVAELLSADASRGGPDFTRFDTLRILGRRLSALASVATLGLLFLLARRVAGRDVALLATALAALAPLPLQQARFLTVDGFAALLATAALLPAVRIAAPRERAERSPWADAALFALLAAMSVASRLNLAPIVLLLPAALLVRGRGARLPLLLRRAALHRAVLAHRLGNDVAHLPARVEAGVGVLKDHLDALAQLQRALAAGLEDGVRVLPVEVEAAARGLVQAHQQARGGALAAARLAHQRQRLALLDGEGGIVHRVQQLARLALQNAVEQRRRDVEGARQAFGLHQGLGRAGRGRAGLGAGGARFDQ